MCACVCLCVCVSVCVCARCPAAKISFFLSKVRWWRHIRPLHRCSFKKFFSFPPLINEGESRLHNAVVLVHIILFNLLGLLALDPATTASTSMTTAQLVLGALLIYGFSARLACGPRLDPHAFFVLFVLSPLLRGTRLFPSLYKDSRPKYEHTLSRSLSLSLSLTLLL